MHSKLSRRARLRALALAVPAAALAVVVGGSSVAGAEGTVPDTGKTDQIKIELTKGQLKFVGPATVEYGDGKLNYGARVPSTVLDVINDECGQTSCNPSGGFGFSTLVVNSDRGNDVSYTISVEGSFALAGERGDKAQLLELAKLGFQEVYNAGVATRREGVIYVINECPAWQTNGCPGKL